MSSNYYTVSCEETERLAKRLAERLPEGSTVAFYGDLGAGKTTLIRYLSHYLAGVLPEEVTSPTFQYLNIYSGKMTIYHFDLYRLRNSSDFLEMGFADMLDSSGACFIEWAERIDDILPKEVIRIRIFHDGEGSRRIQIQDQLFEEPL